MRQIVREDTTLPAVEAGETKWKLFLATSRRKRIFLDPHLHEPEAIQVMHFVV